MVNRAQKNITAPCFFPKPIHFTFHSPLFPGYHCNSLYDGCQQHHVWFYNPLSSYERMNDTDPSLPEHQNIMNYISQMPVWQFFSHATNMSCHNYCSPSWCWVFIDCIFVNAKWHKISSSQWPQVLYKTSKATKNIKRKQHGIVFQKQCTSNIKHYTWRRCRSMLYPWTLHQEWLGASRLSRWRKRKRIVSILTHSNLSLI